MAIINLKDADDVVIVITEILYTVCSLRIKNLYHTGGWTCLHLQEKQEREDPNLVGPSETTSLNPWK
jgi:hypothetical protein